MTHVEHDKVEEFLRQLEQPPPGSAAKVSDREAEKDAQSFRAFASALGMAPPTTA